MVEGNSAHSGNLSEGKGFIKATHRGMSKFDSCMDLGYRRVAEVVGEFVAGAAKAVEGKRLQGSVSGTS